MQLAKAAGIPGQAARRVAGRFGEFALATAQNRDLDRCWRLTRAADVALLLVMAGPPS